jgi:DegV family protein with EDD domain
VGQNAKIAGFGRMTRVAIVTDSTADLEPLLAELWEITVIPVSIRLGSGAFRAGSQADAASPRRPASREVVTGGSGAAMVDAFAHAFADLAGHHDAVVAVLLSSRLGGAVAAARQARARLPEHAAVEIIDSRSASLGLGFQALRAAELARQGASAATIAAELRGAMDRYHVVFSVDSVEHLRQSGSIGRSAAMIAEALQLKPLLRIDEGQIVPYERARTRARAAAELAEFVRALPAVERVAVLYDTDRDDAQRLAEIIAADTGLPPERLTLAQIGSAVAAQVGPGALGVAVVEADVR